MNILIVGAGIASLTLAYWLKQDGHQPVIIEKAPSIRTEGYVLDFIGTGWDVAERMGVIPALKCYEHPIEAVVYKNAQGKDAARLEIQAWAESANVDMKYMAINRRDLVRVLYEHSQNDCEFRFGLSLETVQELGDKVNVTFSDGSQAEFDLVIGGDGIHSQVRKLCFGEESQFSHYLGYHFAVFSIPPLNETLTTAFYMYLEPHLQIGVYPNMHGEWLIYMVYKAESSVIPPQAERAAFLRNIFAAAEWLVPEILQSLTPETYIFMDAISQIQMPSWSKGRVALIGDAAHCPTLISGQGASMAMAGAYFLAQALRQESDYSAAFQAYERRLHPHLDVIQQKARKFAPNFVPASRSKIFMMQMVLKFIRLAPFKKILAKQFVVESLLEPAHA